MTNNKNIEEAKKTSTYNAIIKLIPEYAVASIPIKIVSLCGFKFITNLSKYLILAREHGTYFLYIRNTTINYLGNSIKDFEIIECNQEINQDGSILYYFEINYKKEYVDFKNIITIGLNNDNSIKFDLTEAISLDILKYEDLLKLMYEREKQNNTTIIKLQEFKDLQRGNPQAKKLFDLKSLSFLNRGKKNVVIADAEDTFENYQVSTNNLIINEYKEKIAMATAIPVGYLFKTSNSGLNNTDRRETLKFNAMVMLFLGAFIYPAIDKFLKIQGKKIDELIFEPIDYENKKMNTEIEVLQANKYIELYSMGVINDKELREFLKIEKADNK